MPHSVNGCIVILRFVCPCIVSIILIDDEKDADFGLFIHS